jgi:tetratricopeptide (TPR) repeat protein
MSEIFVSYRSADAQYGAAAIFELLATRFDRERIFLDNQSISPGSTYPDRLHEALESVRVLLVLIGPRWLTPDLDRPDQLPIREERDWVRQEIRRAFERSVRVVPILFDGARLPDPDVLPADVRQLVHCQAVEVSHLRLGDDVTRLAHRLTELLPALARARVTRAPVPRQLPLAPPWFVGRRGELDLLTHEADGDRRVMTAVIVGIGGIGKTWLALHWAHEHADRFPDGQLYVDLRGSSPMGQPMSVSTALRCLLDALGVDHRTVPAEVDAQAGRYRSLVAGRRMLIVLDNADNAAQVGAILPGSPTCTVLVTSRNRLDGLLTSVSARRITLDPLTDADARDLFLRRFGRHRLAAESGAVAALIGYCSGLPLALGIIAGRVAGTVAGEDGLPLAASAAELRDAATRIGALDTGDPATSVTAVLSWSCTALSTRDGRVFGLLGLAPGHSIGLPAVASMTALSTPDARASMLALERMSLVQRQRRDHWQSHALVRLYAASRAEQTLPEADRLAAVRRVIDHYLHTAHAADRLLHRTRKPIELDAPADGATREPLTERSAAMAWFADEYGCLRAAQELAAARGWHLDAWRLAWVMHSFHWQRGQVRDQIATWEIALRAAEHLPDPAARTLAHRLIGSATARTGQLDDVFDHLHHALDLATATGDRWNLAHTYRALARGWEQRTDHERALSQASQALRLFRELGLPADEADALDLMCWYEAKLGRHHAATEHGSAALALYRRTGNVRGEATALDSLGHVAQLAERHTEALDYYRQALTLFSGTHAYHEASTLSRLGEVCLRLAMTDDARDAWTRCLSLYQSQERTADAIRVQHRLAALPATITGEPI